MLNAYRRHKRACAYFEAGRAHTKCGCPIWCDGTLPDMPGRRVNCTLDTANWQVAIKRIRDWEIEGAVIEDTRVPVMEACAAFSSDAAARGLADETLKKHRVLFDQMKAFCEAEKIGFVQEFDPPTVRRFRQSWVDAPLSASKKLERLKTFFRFCVAQGWLRDSPAKGVKAPKVPSSETQPFSRAEMAQIVAACEQMLFSKRVRAFVLLCRYSGLRAGDVASMEKTRIDADGRLFLYTEKSGTPVMLPLPEVVTAALADCQPVSKRHWFWTGEGKLSTLTGNWRRTLRKMFKRAGVPEGHGHRFRDTFAVELLNVGSPIDRVSKLLGHKSVKVTEKHYAAWVRERQRQAEADVRRSWEGDAIATATPKAPKKNPAPATQARHRKERVAK